MEVKSFIKAHKTKIIIGGIIVTGVVATIFAIKFGKGKMPTVNTSKILEEITKAIPNFAKNDLPIPHWEGFEISEHWTENEVQNMILSCHVCDLGTLGEHLMGDMLTQANPDIPIEMILSYGSSCWVGM